MIPWSSSTWSTNDALRALGLTKRTGTCPRTGLKTHDIVRNGRVVVSVGNVFDCNAWLKAEGMVW